MRPASARCEQGKLRSLRGKREKRILLQILRLPRAVDTEPHRKEMRKAPLRREQGKLRTCAVRRTRTDVKDVPFQFKFLQSSCPIVCTEVRIGSYGAFCRLNFVNGTVAFYAADSDVLAEVLVAAVEFDDALRSLERKPLGCDSDGFNIERAGFLAGGRTHRSLEFSWIRSSSTRAGCRKCSSNPSSRIPLPILKSSSQGFSPP